MPYHRNSATAYSTPYGPTHPKNSEPSAPPLKRSARTRTRGGACAGLTPEGANANEGAEATISYLLAHQCMERVAEIESFEPGANADRSADSFGRTP